jgi:hypothetical protein
MAAIIREDATATWPTGMAGVRATACDIVARAMARAAATIIIGAVGAALLQLAAQILSFPAPIAVTAMTLMAASLLTSLRRHLRGSRGSSGDHRQAGTASPARDHPADQA